MQQALRLARVLLPTVVVLASCGGEPGANLVNASQTQQESALLLPRRIIDLDGLFNHPNTSSYTAAASEPGSPCGPMLKDVIKLGEELGPAVAEKNFAVVATHLPEILAATKELFACVKVVKAKQGQGSSLPAAPAVPQHNPTLNPCVVVVYKGNSSSTCP